MKRETGLLLHTQGWKPVSERLTRKVNFFEQIWSVVERIETRSFVQNGVCVWNIKVLRSGILHSSCLHTRELNTDNSCGTVLSSFRCQTLNFIFREIPEKTFVLSSFQTAQNTNAWRVYELYFVYRGTRVYIYVYIYPKITKNFPKFQNLYIYPGTEKKTIFSLEIL